MAKYASRVKETTTTAGAGTINLDGAVTGFRTFLAPSNIADQDYVPYFLLDADGLAWEEGYGKVIAGTPNQLERGFVMDSSNAGAAITLSAGTHTVGIGPIAASRLFHGALVERQTTQSIANNTHTKVQFDAVISDDEGIFSSPSDFIVPAWASKIRAEATVRFAANTSGDRQLYLRKNGINNIAGLPRVGIRSATLQTWVSVFSSIIDVAPGDAISAYAFQTSGTSLNLENDRTQFSISIIE